MNIAAKSSRIFCAVIVLIALSVTPPGALASQERTTLSVDNLRCEYKVNPIGIDTAPRLSWILRSDRRATIQQAYQIRVASSPGTLAEGKNLLWDSGRVESDASIHQSYGGPDLTSGQRCYWQVKVWDNHGTESEWSPAASWEMGLLSPDDWKASWIRADLQDDTSKSGPSPMLRTSFDATGSVNRARLYVTSLGLYEVHLNGEKVGDQVLTPGWTSYNTRLQYQTYDVTDLISPGPNAIGAVLGDGWYRGYLGFRDKRNTYGDKIALLLQLRIEYADGRTQWILSDENWRSSYGPILTSDIYMGEAYDARLEQPGWDSTGFDDSKWNGTQSIEHSKEILLAPAGPPVRRIEEIRPIEILKTPEGDTVFDMGQNLVGWVRLKVNGASGTTVSLQHAEVLDKEGNFYTENLRAAKQIVSYTLKGGGPETYEPHFTFQGFRYVKVDNYPGELTLDSLTGIVVHSDMKVTGSFETSKSLVNQLQHNILWGQKGNFVDVPTDCPQRDERLGWTGDAQVFSKTATFNMDVASFFTKWLGDLAADQKSNGSIPFVIPDVIPQGNGSAAWADAGVIIPWTMYLRYGDRRILEKQYGSMKAWVEYMRARAREDFVWDQGFHFGDWLAYATTRSDYPGATTDKDLIATSFFAYSTSILQKTAAVLGKTEEAAEYARVLDGIRKGFLKEYVTPNARLSSNTQTAYTLALRFGLLPAEMVQKAAERLNADVKSFGTHITTGFVGTPYICHVLSSNGYLDTAYGLLNQDTYPSWLYPVKQGATTIWERWDGIKADGSFQDAGMNSFNHYAYGSIGEWMYGVMAGIQETEAAPGFKAFRVAPQPGGGFTSVKAELESMYGVIRSSWQRDGENMTVRITVPANTTAELVLPLATIASVMEDGQPISAAAGLSEPVQLASAVSVKAGSGSYSFTYKTSGGND